MACPNLVAATFNEFKSQHSGNWQYQVSGFSTPATKPNMAIPKVPAVRTISSRNSLFLEESSSILMYLHQSDGSNIKGIGN